MKFAHLSDLHIGRRLNEYPLTEDQEYILNEIVNIIKNEKCDCVFISGDVYDKTMPSAEAVRMLDDFLSSLADSGTQTFIISGNHDSQERIAYGEKLFRKNGIYLSPVFDGRIEKYELYDEYGRVNIYLLPFIKPQHVRRYYDDIENCTDAVKAVTDSLEIDVSERNVILSHQFVSGSERCDSEDISIGGIDSVEAAVYDKFDYAALGHIHKSQKIGDNIYYSGTPLKYSASEANHKKCVLIGELKEKGQLLIKSAPLTPLRDYKDIKGNLEDLLKTENSKDYVRITLTDDETVIDAYAKLRQNYPLMTELVFERQRSYFEGGKGAEPDKAPMEQFEDFYYEINQKKLTDEQMAITKKLLQQVREDI